MKSKTQKRSFFADQHVDANSGAIDQRRGLRGFLEDIGDRRAPYTGEAFECRIRSQMKLAAEDPMPGFSKYSEPLRKTQLGHLYVANTGSVLRAISRELMRKL